MVFKERGVQVGVQAVPGSKKVHHANTIREAPAPTHGRANTPKRAWVLVSGEVRRRVDLGLSAWDELSGYLGFS